MSDTFRGAVVRVIVTARQQQSDPGTMALTGTYVKCFQRLVLPFAPRSVTTTQPPSCTFLRRLFACTTDSFAQRPRSRRRAMPLQVERAIGRGLYVQIVFTPPKRPLPGCTLTPLNLVHILLPVLYGSASST